MIAMPRRLHVPQITAGQFDLPVAQAHHARDVLRLAAGQTIEIFDDAGAVASATIIACDPSRVTVTIDRTNPAPPQKTIIIIASAVPKSTRADWMIEKLSELGVDRFIPLATERSVVVPEGKQKLARWSRLASEAARQSRRHGVMKIHPVTTLPDLLARLPEFAAKAVYLSPDSPTPLTNLMTDPSDAKLLLIGPEGGWSDAETAMFTQAGLAALRLTDTILRIETAAIVAAAIASLSSCERPRPA